MTADPRATARAWLAEIIGDPNIRVQWQWAIPPFRAYWTRVAYDGHTYEVGVCRWTPWAARDRAEQLVRDAQDREYLKARKRS